MVQELAPGNDLRARGASPVPAGAAPVY